MKSPSLSGPTRELINQYCFLDASLLSSEALLSVTFEMWARRAAMHGFCWGDAFNTQPKLCEGTAERDLGKGHMGAREVGGKV